MSLIDTFEDYLNDNNQPASVRGYLSDVRTFLTWFESAWDGSLTGARLKREPHILNKAVIESFIKMMHAEKRSLNTINRYTASLRVFGNFLVAAGLLQINPAGRVAIKKLPAPAPRGLMDDERYRLEYVFREVWERRNNKTERSRELTLAPKLIVRDRAIFLMLLYTGLRVAELTALDMEDIDINPRSGKLLIREGKGGNPRMVGVPRQVRAALTEWFQLRKEIGVRENALFVDLKQSQKRLTSRSIQNMIKEAGQRAGVEVSPHILRHTYAYMLRTNGVQPEVRARLMGHSISMAMRYGSPRDAELNAAVQGLEDQSSY